MLAGRFERGQLVRVRGRVQRFRDELQIELRAIELAEGPDADPARFLPTAYRDRDELEGFLEHLAREVYHPGLQALLGALLGGITPAGFIVTAALACRFVLQVELDRALFLRDDVYWPGPLRDMMSFGVFVASFFSRRVEWRGHRYAVRADNTLAYYGEAESNADSVPSGALVRRI